MAKLQSNDLTLEIKFKGFKDEWVIYEIKCCWKDETIVKDSILKRTGEWQGSPDAFFANDYQKDYLIETIKKVLKTNEPEYWEPMEPDSMIAIYPGMTFPFLKSHWTLIEENNEEIEPEKRENENGEQPNDLFTIIAFIDSYNFKDSGAYSGEGISFHLTVRRIVLEKFVTELELEYTNLRR